MGGSLRRIAPCIDPACLSPHGDIAMTARRLDIPGSQRPAPQGAPSAPPDPQTPIEVSLYLKRPAGAEPDDREGLRRAREASLQPAFQAVEAFAQSHGLTISEQDAARRLVKLQGPLSALEAAFGTKVGLFTAADGGAYRARAGSLSAPAEVTGHIEAVLGLDQRPIATSKLVKPKAQAVEKAHLPNAVAEIYGFASTAASGQGQCIALIELGGGVSEADTQAAFSAMGLAPPQVVAVPVSGGSNQPGKDTGADGEVALDVQVAGAGAPGAKIAVYFAPNTDQGFVDAISQATHDSANAPSVMSISWGSAENGWTQQAVTAMTSALQDAAQLGLSVFVASGDNLASDGVDDGQAHVDFPASSPWAVGCGGTYLPGAAGDESVWNREGSGGGGGISTLFPPPDYQSGIDLPASVNAGAAAGRGVPDVSGDADPQSGYQVVVDGQTQVVGGTSAVAPLWAGLFAQINAGRAKPVGQPHAVLYAHAEAFNDIVRGNNETKGLGYKAGPGWDACTGLGTPKGAALLTLFR